VTFQDGFIVNYREYWNPIAFIAAMSCMRFLGGDGSAKLRDFDQRCASTPFRTR
jgi:hypothetical protein